MKKMHQLEKMIANDLIPIYLHFIWLQAGSVRHFFSQNTLKL